MQKLRLLLVDDEREFVETLAHRLKMRDVDATIANHGEEALAAVEKEEPDVIVLDLKMPGMDGIEVLKRVKEAYPNVEVIILTGHGSKKDEEDARKLGAFDYVNKPADLDALLARVRSAFKRRLKKLEKASIAVAFAEAGEFDTAVSMMEDDDETKPRDDR